MSLRSASSLLARVGLVAAGVAASAPAHADDRPDVIVVLLDTLRKDRISIYDEKHPTTPFMSSISSQGAVFDGAVATGSHTAPTTASIFTSLFPMQHGITTGFFALQNHKFETTALSRAITTLATIPPAVTTMPEAFQAAGYETYGVAGNVNICEELGFASGFDRFALLDDDDSKTHAAPRAEVLVETLVLCLLGGALGMLLGPFAVTLLGPLEFADHATLVPQTDRSLLAIAFAGLVASAVVAGLPAANRAARLDPAVALRDE